MHTTTNRPAGRRDAPRRLAAALLAALIGAAGCASQPAPVRVEDQTPARGAALRADITECWTMAWHEAQRRALEAAAGRPVDGQAVWAASVPLARACLLLRGLDLPPVER